MRVLVDECLPKQIKRAMAAEVVRAVPEMGWASKKNGELLDLAQADFDVLLTNDTNLEFQQNLKRFSLAIVVLVAKTNDIADLRSLMPAANRAIENIKTGEMVYIRPTAD